MWAKILNVCLAASVLLSIALGIYIVTYDKECERIHLDVISKISNWIPEEEGAKEIAAAYIGLAKDWEEQENPRYDAEVIFNEKEYEWIVIFSPKLSDCEERIIGIRKDYGVITEYENMP